MANLGSLNMTSLPSPKAECSHPSSDLLFSNASLLLSCPRPTETQAFAKAMDAFYLRILASFMDVTVSKLDLEHLLSLMELGGLVIQPCELAHDLEYLSS